MTILRIEGTQKLRCTVQLPASKSISNRALIISALSGSNERPQNVSDCDDTRVMVRALTEMPAEIDIMAAGTAMRFLTAYLSVTPGTHTITGTERMRHRPIGLLVDALRRLGASVEYAGEEGFPPLRITGSRLQGGTLEIPGNVSSQYISALLMVGPALAEGLTLRLTGKIISRPYIDMTLSIMRHYGARVEWAGDDAIRVWPQAYVPAPYLIENDWSAASYWYQMVALTSDAGAEVRLPGLFSRSTQGDSRVAEMFRALGVETEFEAGENPAVILRKSGACVSRLQLDMVEQPDLAQTIVATCIALGIPFHLTGLQSLKIKETDRISALRNEFRKLGFLIGEANDSELLWNGERCEPEPDATLDTYEDHRMAMALAPCCLRLGALRIANPQVVSKSYPDFWQHLQSAGFIINSQL